MAIRTEGYDGTKEKDSRIPTSQKNSRTGRRSDNLQRVPEIDNMNDRSTRRSFLNWLIGFGLTGWIVSVIYPIIRYIIPPESREAEVTAVSLGKIKDFKNESGTIFKFGTKPGIILRLSSGEFRAFSATCTHLDCTVQYSDEMKLIWCACHNGKYDLSGKNIAGPPPRPLTEYEVILKGEEVFVKKG